MSQVHTVGKHKTNIYQDDEGFTCIRYNYTNVVRFNKHVVQLNSGGWETNTTKLRMNQAARQFSLDYSVYQKKYQWYVVLPGGETVEFSDGMSFNRM